VTLSLPLALARKIPSRMIDGVIEGLREQQVGYLIRSLPKDLRKRVESIPSVARTIAHHPVLKDAPLLEGIIAVLSREFGITVPQGALSLESLPTMERALGLVTKAFSRTAEPIGRNTSNMIVSPHLLSICSFEHTGLLKSALCDWPKALRR
jgi:hypothetical protein